MKHLILLTALAAAFAPASASARPGGPGQPPTVADSPAYHPGWRPARERGYGNYDTPYDRDDRWDFHDRWIVLSSFTPARQGRETVYLTGKDRRIDKVRISAVRGAPVVKQVIVQYGNGEYERRPVNQRLRPGRDAVIGLDTTRRVKKVMVLTDRTSRGAYSLYGAG